MKHNFLALSDQLLNGPHAGRCEIRLNPDVLAIVNDPDLHSRLNIRGGAGALFRTALDCYMDTCNPCPACGCPLLDPRSVTYKVVGGIKITCPNCGKEQVIETL